VVLANGRLRAERVILGVLPSSSCLGIHPTREEFLSAPIHSPPLSGRLIGPSTLKHVIMHIALYWARR
jgi:hypothetical protein